MPHPQIHPLHRYYPICLNHHRIATEIPERAFRVFVYALLFAAGLALVLNA